MNNLNDAIQIAQTICTLLIVFIAVLGGKYALPLITDKRWKSIAERAVLAAAQICKAAEGDNDVQNAAKLAFAIDAFVTETGAVAKQARLYIEAAFRGLKKEGKVQ